MTARRFRFYVVFAATLVVGWLVAFPAMASGPMCDDRGATSVAPSPTLITPHQSLQIEASDDGCVERFLDQASLHGHRAPWERPHTPDSEAVLPKAPRLAPPIGEALPPLAAEHEAAHPGVRSRVERPPRG